MCKPILTVCFAAAMFSCSKEEDRTATNGQSDQPVGHQCNYTDVNATMTLDEVDSNSQVAYFVATHEGEVFYRYGLSFADLGENCVSQIYSVEPFTIPARKLNKVSGCNPAIFDHSVVKKMACDID